MDTPFNKKFWDFFRSVLEKAKPVGFLDAESPTAVAHKGPKDNEAFLKKVSETSLINPIHPILLAKASGVSVGAVLTELLYATKTGMMSMKMTPNCLRCGSSVCAMDNLQEIKQGAKVYCEGCRYENTIECLQKIKVLFILNMDVFYVLAENFACQPSKASTKANKVFAMVPATFSGSGFRYSFGCGGDKELRPCLPAGRYRMHCPVSKTDNYLVVERDANADDKPANLVLHVSDIVCRANTDDKRKTLTAPHGRIHMDIFTDTKSFFVCWIQDDLDDHTLLFLPEEERQPYTNVQELLGHPTYQFWFGDGTEANLSRVVKRMSMTKPTRPRKRARPMRSSQA